MAADPLDNACELQALFNQTAIAKQLSTTQFHLASLTHCTDCGFEIEQERRALGGVKRCTECEGFYQREAFLKTQKV